MAHFNIYHVRVNDFYRLYDDIIASLRGSLIDLDHSCTVRQNTYALDAVNILVGSTIFASRYHALPSALKDSPYIVYQLEYLDNSRGLLRDWPEYWELLSKASAVWDYSPASTHYLRAKGLTNVFYVPPGFHRSLETFRQRPNPDIDVLFCGSPHERRGQVLDALRNRGVNVVNLHGSFGETRNAYMARSKIILNMHAWDGLASLETVRVSFALANRAFVVSEVSDDNPYEDGVVFGEHDDLADLCVAYLREPAETRDRIAEAGYLAVRRLDQVNILRDVLGEMGPAALRSMASTTGWATGIDHTQPRLDILTAVPIRAQRVLDIGCGGGWLGANLKQRQQCHVTGIEMSPEAALLATRTLDLAICADAFTALPMLPDGAYDSVLLIDVLEHIADTAALLRLAAKKLAPDGVMVLCVGNVAHWSVVQNLLSGRWDHVGDNSPGPTPLRFFTFRTLRQLAGNAGLQITESRSAQLSDDQPSETLVAAYRHHAAPGINADAMLRSYKFVVTCRKIAP